MASKRSSKKKRNRNHVKHDKEEANKKRFSIIIGTLIAVIMISSVFGVMFSGYNDNAGSTVRYGDFKFKETNYGYELNFEDKDYYFELLPSHVEDINISSVIKNTIQGAEALIITSDPNSSYKEDIALSSYNVNLFMVNQDKFVGVGFTEENEEYPIITCANASFQYPIMELIESNETSVSIENSCIKVKFANAYSLKQVVARILFNYIGVFDNE